MAFACPCHRGKYFKIDCTQTKRSGVEDIFETHIKRVPGELTELAAELAAINAPAALFAAVEAFASTSGKSVDRASAARKAGDTLAKHVARCYRTFRAAQEQQELQSLPNNKGGFFEDDIDLIAPVWEGSEQPVVVADFGRDDEIHPIRLVEEALDLQRLGVGVNWPLCLNYGLSKSMSFNFR